MFFSRCYLYSAPLLIHSAIYPIGIGLYLLSAVYLLSAPLCKVHTFLSYLILSLGITYLKVCNTYVYIEDVYIVPFFL